MKYTGTEPALTVEFVLLGGKLGLWMWSLWIHLVCLFPSQGMGCLRKLWANIPAYYIWSFSSAQFWSILPVSVTHRNCLAVKIIMMTKLGTSVTHRNYFAVKIIMMTKLGTQSLRVTSMHQAMTFPRLMHFFPQRFSLFPTKLTFYPESGPISQSLVPHLSKYCSDKNPNLS